MIVENDRVVFPLEKKPVQSRAEVWLTAKYGAGNKLLTTSARMITDDECPEHREESK